jgi:surface antigen
VIGPAVAIIVTGLCAGGCSVSYQLGSLEKEGAKPDVTGAITPVVARENVADGDLAVASATASDVLANGQPQTSAPWHNPKTGARGMITPLANSYTQDGFVCRDFLASYVRDADQTWLQGEACRLHQGKWVVRSLKPWKRV